MNARTNILVIPVESFKLKREKEKQAKAVKAPLATTDRLHLQWMASTFTHLTQDQCFADMDACFFFLFISLLPFSSLPFSSSSSSCICLTICLFTCAPHAQSNICPVHFVPFTFASTKLNLSCKMQTSIFSQPPEQYLFLTLISPLTSFCKLQPIPAVEKAKSVPIFCILHSSFSIYNPPSSIYHVPCTI